MKLLVGHTMKYRDLPLTFLPAFEAAGRLGSFAAAAVELHLTPSAISQQIRSLEDALGVQLFQRTNRCATLTRDGEAYLAEVRSVLDTLAVSTSRLQRRGRGSVLRVSTMSLAAHEFLLPRLPAFQTRFPGIELRIETTNDTVDFETSDVDAALRVGSGGEDLQVHPLGDACVAPVCSPALGARIQTVQDLRDHPLLDGNGDGTRSLWDLLALHGLSGQQNAASWRFESCFETLRAAEHGLGVALAVFPVATPWIEQRRLVVPLPLRAPLHARVCFVHRANDERFPFAGIALWLQEQYSALPALPPGRVV